MKRTSIFLFCIIFNKIGKSKSLSRQEIFSRLSAFSVRTLYYLILLISLPMMCASYCALYNTIYHIYGDQYVSEVVASFYTFGPYLLA